MTSPDDPRGSTEVVERRLRGALAQRADRTEPADDALDRIVAAADGAPRRDRRRRSAGLVAAAAVLVAVVAVAVAVSRPGSESVDITDDPGRTTTSPSTTTEAEGPAPTSVPTTAPETTTVPGSSTTTTTPPATTTTPPTTTAPPPVLPGASTDAATGSGTPGAGIAHLADVRIGADDGFDRVVIELLDGTLPDWSVAYVDPPINQDGSGEPVAVAGDAFLLVTMTPASAYDLDGETPVPTYPGPARLPGPGPQVVEVVQVGDYEAVATWAIGLRGPVPFRVTTLTAPARIVVDIAHEAPGTS
jgi:hypothetical protein